MYSVFDATEININPDFIGSSTVPDQLKCGHCFCMAGTDSVHYCHRCGMRKEPALTTFNFSKEEQWKASESGL